jgi:hypothetical protein
MTDCVGRCSAPVGVASATCTGERIRLELAAVRAHCVSYNAQDIARQDARGRAIPNADREQAWHLGGIAGKKGERTVYISQFRLGGLDSCGNCPGSVDITGAVRKNTAQGTIRTCESCPETVRLI